MPTYKVPLYFKRFNVFVILTFERVMGSLIIKIFGYTAITLKIYCDMKFLLYHMGINFQGVLNFVGLLHP